MPKIDIKKTKNILEVRLSLKGDEWEEYLEKSKKNIYDNLELKGFRKGKVPEDIATKYVKNDEVFSKAIDKVVEKNVSNVLEEMQKHKIITKPTLSIEKVSNNSVTLLFVSHLLPNIKLPDYLNFKLDYSEKNVTDKEINEEMDKIKQLFIVKEKYDDKEHKVEEGDTVNIDFIGKVNGEKFEGGEAKEFDLKIGSKSFVDNFEEQLVGSKVGDSKNIKVKFPDTYPESSLAGKEADFEVKINSISSEKQPVGDKLVEQLNKLGFNSMEELKNRVELMLKEQFKQNAADEFFKKFLDMIIDHEDTEIEIPFQLLEDEIEHQFAHFKEDLEKQNMKIEDYFKMLNTNEKKFKDETLQKQAEKRVKDGLIYSRLVEDNDIKDITEEEFEDEYKKIAELQKLSIDEIRERIPKEKLRDSLIFLKLIELLKENISK